MLLKLVAIQLFLISSLFSFEFSTTPQNPIGGEALLVSIKGPSYLEYEISFGGKSFVPFRASSGKREIFIPIPIELKGVQLISIKEKFLGITINKKLANIEITPRKFRTIKLRPSSERMRDRQPAVPEQKAAIWAALRHVSTEKKWSSGFAAPLELNISQPFAVKREGARYSYFHKGVDYPAKTGTPVKAANDGKVIFSEKGLNIYGNMLVIDHGQGVISCYWHLNDIFKNEGEYVTKGEVVAEVGSTGWSTGPHLHFGVYIQGEAVDPVWFIDFTRTKKDESME